MSGCFTFGSNVSGDLALQRSCFNLVMFFLKVFSQLKHVTTPLNIFRTQFDSYYGQTEESCKSNGSSGNLAPGPVLPAPMTVAINGWPDNVHPLSPPLLGLVLCMFAGVGKTS